MMSRPLVAAALVIAAPAALSMAGPAAAQQQSAGYKFLQAIKEAKGNDVVAILDQPGQTIVNTRDTSTGETALHIVARRGDLTYLTYLLQKGADPNARDNQGNTAMLLAVELGQDPIVDTLLKVKANPNLGNRSGVTPLIRATQKGNMPLVRALIAGGGDPDQADYLAGMSARDYAKQDPRLGAMAKLIAETPKKVQKAVAGPKLR